MVNKKFQTHKDFEARSLYEVLNEWHHFNYEEISEAKEVILRGMWPPINAIDKSLKFLKSCVVLSLSKNKIEKICYLNYLKYLKVLSLAQNNIKSLKGLEDVKDTLEVLIIARNFIKNTKGIENLYKLNELDISYNLIDNLGEFFRLMECSNLKNLTFKENPVVQKYPDQIWRHEALKIMPQLDIYDYIKIEDSERHPQPTKSEMFKLEGNMIVNCPRYEIYNRLLQEAWEKVREIEREKEKEEEEKKQKEAEKKKEQPEAKEVTKKTKKRKRKKKKKKWEDFDDFYYDDDDYY